MRGYIARVLKPKSYTRAGKKAIQLRVGRYGAGVIQNQEVMTLTQIDGWHTVHPITEPLLIGRSILNIKFEPDTI